MAFIVGGPASVKLACRARGLYTTPEPECEVPPMLNPVLWLILTIIDIYFYVILAAVIMSWLVAFNVINRSNNLVRQIWYALNRLTEPLLAPIRSVLPDLGGIDVSPIVLLLLLQFVRYIVVYTYFNVL
jgi:YggT family protein